MTYVALLHLPSVTGPSAHLSRKHVDAMDETGPVNLAEALLPRSLEAELGDQAGTFQRGQISFPYVLIFKGTS